MDVLVLLLKMAVRQYGSPTLTLGKTNIHAAESADLHMARHKDGRIELKLVEGLDPANTKIILPHGQSPLTLL
jgi:hypothetical protein